MEKLQTNLQEYNKKGGGGKNFYFSVNLKSLPHLIRGSPIWSIYRGMSKVKSILVDSSFDKIYIIF